MINYISLYMYVCATHWLTLWLSSFSLFDLFNSSNSWALIIRHKRMHIYSDLFGGGWGGGKDETRGNPPDWLFFPPPPWNSPITIILFINKSIFLFVDVVSEATRSSLRGHLKFSWRVCPQTPSLGVLLHTRISPLWPKSCTKLTWSVSKWRMAAFLSLSRTLRSSVAI